MSEGSEDIRALRRGVVVLELLARGAAMSLAALHKTTGTPKSTLRRILATLESAGLVRRSLGDGLYRANFTFLAERSAQGEAGWQGRLAQVAAPVLKQMCQRLAWPSDLWVRSGINMEILDSSRPQCLLTVGLNEIGDRVNLPYSAVGRAYLAFCPEKEREDIIARLIHAVDLHGVRAATFQQALFDELAVTQERGYGVRHQRFTGATHNQPRAVDRLSAIAVPIHDGERVLGCINMLWQNTTFTVDYFASCHVGDLRLAAGTIAAAFRESSHHLPDGRQ